MLDKNKNLVSPCDNIIIVNIKTYQRIMDTRKVKRINCIIFLICIIMGCLLQANYPDTGMFMSGNNGVQSERIISFGHIVLEDAISPVPIRGGEAVFLHPDPGVKSIYLHFKYSTKQYKDGNAVIKELMRYLPNFKKNRDCYDLTKTGAEM